MKKVCLLGASGNIGTQALDILFLDRTHFLLKAISVGERVNKIPSILERFPSIEWICVKNENDYLYLKETYPNLHFYHGDDGLLSLLKDTDAEMVVNALVGFAGLLPSIRALELNKILCLANKESLVVGGRFIKSLLKEGHGTLYPIDSEHVAIAKCFSLVSKDEVKRILITGSGGAFRNKKREELQNVTPELALNHPTWNMGKKITIDSDTMFNKGFEVIEASILFDWPIDDIKVILHDESHLHSALELKNGTLIGEVSKPDMHGPIAYALYEGKVKLDDILKVKSLDEFGPYHFHLFDEKRYPAVKIATSAYQKGGAYGAVLNAAVEECDYLFLEKKIPFLSIEEWVKKALLNVKSPHEASLRDILIADHSTREYLRLEVGD